jgi:uncharacterized protein HemX
MNKTISEVIRESLASNGELDASMIAEMIELLDEKQQAVAPRNQKLIFVRNAINSALRSAGYKVLNVRKNTYKAVKTFDDYMKYRKKRAARMYALYREIKELDEQMLSMGIPVPVEFNPEMEEIAHDTAAESNRTRAAH